MAPCSPSKRGSNQLVKYVYLTNAGQPALQNSQQCTVAPPLQQHDTRFLCSDNERGARDFEVHHHASLKNFDGTIPGFERNQSAFVRKRGKRIGRHVEAQRWPLISSNETGKVSGIDCLCVSSDRG